MSDGWVAIVMVLAAGLGLGAALGVVWQRGRRRVGPRIDHDRFIQEKAFRRVLQLEINYLRQENQRYLNLFVNLPAAVKRLHVRQTMEEATASIVRLTKDILSPDEIEVFLYVPETRDLRLQAAYNAPSGLPAPYVIPLGEGPVGLTASRRTMLTWEDFVAADSSASAIHSSMCAPLVFEDTLLGVLSIGRVGSGTGHERMLLAMIADIAAIDLYHAARRLMSDREAVTDPLTELFNRRYFFQRLDDEIQRSRNYEFACSVFLFDLDDFKHYNDAHGHPAGDELLRSLTHAVRRQTRKSDPVARYGGEEFIVLLAGVARETAAVYAEKIRRLIESMDFPHAENQPLGRVTISGGVASFPNNGNTVEELIQAADAALYQAKRAGKNRVLQATGTSRTPLAHLPPAA